ncbi:MAG TPA: sugar phosphate isomerase/epimerase [Humisphaera sp.]
MTRDASPALPPHTRRSFLKLGAAAVAVAHGGRQATGAATGDDATADSSPADSTSTGLAVGLQSYSLRHLPLDAALRALRLNLHATVVELCPQHLAGLDPADVAATLRRHGVRPWSVGVVPFGTDADANRRTFETAKALGTRNLSCDPDPEALADLDDLAAEQDVTVAVHPGGPGHRWGTPDRLEAALAGRSTRVGLCADTGHLIRAGADPVAVLRRFAGRLHAVHLKDFRRSADGSAWEDVVAGTANLDLAEVARFLATLPRRVPVFVEYEGPDALAWVRQSMDRVRSAEAVVARDSAGSPEFVSRA